MGAAYESRAWQTPADSRLMQALVSRCWTADWPAMHLHAGDVDWWTVHALGRSPGLAERIRLWYAGEPDGTELVGFGWYGPPGDADLVVDPAHRSIALLGPMVAWVDERASRYGATAPSRLGGPYGEALVGPAGAEPVRVWAVETAAPIVDALVALGCTRGPEPGFLHFTATTAGLDLTGPPIATGYALSAVRTEVDIAGRVAAGHAAFLGSTMTVEKYRFCRTTPLYRPALDLIARAPDGSVVAFALGWLDPLTLGVELEPVGVVPDHRRRGLGAAVSRAALRAATGLGATRALITAEAANPAANALYASLGLRVEARVVAWLRPGRA